MTDLKIVKPNEKDNKKLATKKPNCLSCEFAFEGAVDVNSLKKQAVCRRYPPVSYPIPTNGGLAFVTTFPQINGDMICFEFIEVKQIID